MANAQESELNCVFGDTLPEPGRGLPAAGQLRQLAGHDGVIRFAAV